MNVLITGGAGFIGSHLTDAFLTEGHAVRVLDNLSSGRIQNLSHCLDSIDMIEGDIRDYWTVQRAIADIDIIMHQAALPSVPRSVANPLTSTQVNITGTLNILEAARLAGAKRVVMASSSSVYGDTETLPKHEDMPPSPMSPYAVTKYTGEQYAFVYHSLYELETVCLRYFNIFGPRQDPNGEYAAVIPKFIMALAAGQSPVVFGDGEQSRDFTFIDDCVQANVLAAGANNISGQAFNVACGGRFTLNQLLERLHTIMDMAIDTAYDPPRPGDIMHSYADISKLGHHGYSPQVSFEEGLRQTVAYFTVSSGESSAESSREKRQPQ